VLVNFKVPIAEGEISEISYSFYKLQKKLFRKRIVNAVWVKIDTAASEAKITSFGDYSYEQVQQITVFVGSEEFPPPALDLAQVILQPRDIIRLLK